MGPPPSAEAVPTPDPSRKREGRTVREAIAAATTRLNATSETPRLDAELLAAHLLGIGREAMLLGRLDNMIGNAEFDALVARRAAGEPMAYILGHREFWSLDLAVGPGVLVPRPDSETLIEAARAHFAGTAGPESVLDLGTGSGALLLAALSEWPDARGIGIDRSEAALVWAKRNADALGFATRAGFRLGDWAEDLEGWFDLILCNPPYVETGADLPRDVREYEPAEALFAGEDGLEEYRRIARALGPLLSLNGIACIEIGASQADRVARLLSAQGLKTRLFRDLAGRDRCLLVHS